MNDEYMSRCPACGDFIDFCQGHGEIGDPEGHAILALHDDGHHRLCSNRADCYEESWLAFDHPDDEEASHEATVTPTDTGWVVGWCHTAVGQVIEKWFPTLDAAHAFLECNGYQNFTS